MSRKLALLAVVVFSIFPSYYSNSFAAQKKERPRKTLPAKKAVKVDSLRKIDQLKQAFKLDTGKVRFVTILSPT